MYDYYRALPSKPLRLVMDVRTRWNSTLLMLQRLLQVRNEFNQTLESNGKPDETISYEQAVVIGELVAFLKEFEVITERVSANK